MIACSASSQPIDFVPDGRGRFCTDSAGLRQVARFKVQAQHLQLELLLRDSLSTAQDREQALLQKRLELHQAALDSAAQEAQKARAQYQSEKRKKVYWGLSGFALALLVVIIL